MGAVVEAVFWTCIGFTLIVALGLGGLILYSLWFERNRARHRVVYYATPPSMPHFDSRLGPSPTDVTARLNELRRAAIQSGLQFAELDNVGRGLDGGPKTRAVGYCPSPDCISRGSGTFLLNPIGSWNCPVCDTPGTLEFESGRLLNDTPVIRKVEVEFNYNPITQRYHDVAMIIDTSLPEEGSNTYTLKSPLVKTEKRAMKVAEGLLAVLQRERPEDEHHIPRITETVMSFDLPREGFAIQCEELHDALEATIRHRNKLKLGQKDIPSGS